MSHGGISRDRFSQEQTMSPRQPLETLLCAFVRIEQSHLQVQDRLPRHAETEVSRLDDPGMNGTDRDFEHTFAGNGTKWVVMAFHTRDRCIPAKVLAQRPVP